MIKAHQAVQDILEGAETDFRRVWVICAQSFSSTAGRGHLNSTSSIVYLENRFRLYLADVNIRGFHGGVD